MWPVFCRNYDPQTQESDLDRLFSRYGKIVRIEMKPGRMPWKMSFYIGLSYARDIYMPDLSHTRMEMLHMFLIIMPCQPH
ncbi:serine/arginine-rich splicing factor RS31-like [Salvia divinorum]|uniref:Serine/arginine-rich splicing factor RS31-like n=1 Tax=Salvia divinorum TaxID=28513 RepID=A0ABD1IC24_SALDI